MGEYFTSGLFCLQRKHLACEYFLTVCFHGEELLTLRPSLRLEDHPLSTILDCLFNLFVATLHIGGRSSIRNLRTHHAVATGTHKHSKPKAYTIILIFSSHLRLGLAVRSSGLVSTDRGSSQLLRRLRATSGRGELNKCARKELWIKRTCVVTSTIA